MSASVDGQFVTCPRCEATVELLDDGTMASHDTSWHIGAPPCPSGRQTPLDARDTVLAERTLRLIVEIEPSWHVERIEVHPLALYAIRRYAQAHTPRDPQDVPQIGGLFGIPLVLKVDLPAGAWRALGRDGAVIREGRLTG